MSIVSPRRADQQIPLALLEAAAKLLAEGGPAALSTRRLAAAVGTSTMTVYTHFGGMDDLVRAMVREGFTRLRERMGRVEVTEDPVADVITLGCAYRGNAKENPYLYAVMFGGSEPGGFALTDEDRQYGRYTLDFVVDAVQRCMVVRRLRPGDPQLVARQLWIALHGLVNLELRDYLDEPYDGDALYESQLQTLLVGSGDEQEQARRSMAAAWRRYSGATGRPVRMTGAETPVHKVLSSHL
jgi:AcrR family transcriptional regulator